MEQVIQPENHRKCGNTVKNKKSSQEAKSKIRYRRARNSRISKYPQKRGRKAYKWKKFMNKRGMRGNRKDQS